MFDRRVLAAFFINALLSPIAYADSPTVSSFTINPSSISNDYNVSLTWTVENGDGQDLYFNCPEGITLKITGGSTFPCNTRHAGSSNVSDSIGVTVTNVSGTTKTVSVTVYPKGGSTDNDAGAQTQSFTVTTATQPITDFSASKGTIDSGSSATFTWSGVDTPATNIQIDCVNGLTVYSGTSASGTALPCGTPAFSSDQAQSGSVTLTFVNSLSNQIGAIIRVLPAIKSGLYDSTHSLSAAVAVNAQQYTSTQVIKNPSITNASLSVTTAQSGVPFTIGWTAKDASSTNIQYACNDSLTLFAIGNSTTTLACGTPAFSTPLTDSGSTTLMVISKAYVPQNLNIIMLPRDTNGVYLLSGSRTLVLPVQYQSLSPTPASAVQATNSSSSTVTTVATSTGGHGLSHIPFFRLLSRGSKGPEVVALQLFLGLNHDIYPEGSATGFFGPATQRAVQRFQEKYGIAKAGDQGYGIVGPKTRAKLNAITWP